ncbi:hypothetical protein [Mesomycoplasma dispar]|uniref:Choline kinase n=1 Tax=Mesomycoplasma dispar TaxID=86660 RepID=A0ABM6PRQ5_9BACT|nr:hypothetical protein [Mesomycoplasma dispar]ATP59826.1 hypothetical protein CSW10_02725 [Mesomycoplasma dispar]
MKLKSTVNFDVFPEFVRKEIKKSELISCGYHNCSFVGFFKNQKVQIRVANNDFVNWENEKNFIQENSNFLFYDQGNFIKKWIEGQILSPENLDLHLGKLFLAISDFHKQKNTKIAKFNWQTDVILDKKYISLVEKYQFDSLVISHNDLQFKNIIVSTKAVFLIDFEWIRLNNPYFDYVCLYINLGISPEKIIKFFNLEIEKFNDFVYIVNVFTNFWNKKFYDK